MANAQKYTRAACGHLAAHYERKKDEKGEYIKFGNQDIDPQKTHLNYNLAPRRGLEQIDFIRQRTTEARTLKRDDVNVMCSWVVTLPEYRHLDSFRDWHFEVVNEATKDGNKEIAELKKQTAHEEVLKAQQEALQARQRALQEQESIKPLVEQKNALRGEIEALQTEKAVFGLYWRSGRGENCKFLFRRRRRDKPKNPVVKGCEGWRFAIANTTPSLDYWIAWYTLPRERPICSRGRPLRKSLRSK